MKKLKLLFILIALCACVFSSCEKEKVTEEVKTPLDFTPEDPYGTMFDGGLLQTLNIDVSPSSYKHYSSSDQTFDDYSAMGLLVEPEYSESAVNSIYDYLSTEEATALNDSVYHYGRERTSFVQQALKNNADARHYAWVPYGTAYINGDVTVTCNKTLYGKEPGENLAEYFNVRSYALYTIRGIENPVLTYILDEDVPKKVNEFFTNETWTEYEYTISFDSIPEEKYDEISLTMTMPLKVEHIHKYFQNKVRGFDRTMEITTKTISGSFTARFKQ